MINSSSNKNLYSLPNEMFWEISKFLNFKEIMAFAKTCRCYYNESKNEKFWTEQLKKFNFEDLESILNLNTNTTLKSLLKDFKLPQQVLIANLISQNLISQIDPKNTLNNLIAVISIIQIIKMKPKTIEYSEFPLFIKIAQKYIKDPVNTAINITRIIADIIGSKL